MTTTRYSSTDALRPTQNTATAATLQAGSQSGGGASVAPGMPVLTSPSWSGTAEHMTITLNFTTDMARGTGNIYITDGAVQTVIDRVTGQPTLRIVGATDTHVIPVGSAAIDGGAVTLQGFGLKAGHNYSVIMDAGVLTSTAGKVFAGVRMPNQVSFPTPVDPGPTVTSIEFDGGVLKSGGSIGVTITFSEAVATPPADAFEHLYANLVDLASTDGGRTWQARLVPAVANTTVSESHLNINLAKVRDLAGNAGNSEMVSSPAYAVDTQAPTATIELAGEVLRSGAPVMVTIRFSEAVAGLAPEAISTPNASLSDLRSTDGGITWTANLTATSGVSTGGNRISIDMGQVRDMAGNAGTANAISPEYTVDGVAPSVSIAIGDTTVGSGEDVGVTFRFSEAMASLDPAAISAPNATVHNLVKIDANTWQAVLRAAGSDILASGNQISLDMSRVVDAAGNPGSGTVTSPAYAVDTRGPTATVTLDGAVLSPTRPLTLTIVFNEAVETVPAGAITAPGATVSGLAKVNDFTWTAQLIGASDTGATGSPVSVDMSQVRDLHGNAGSGSAVSIPYTVDITRPTASIALDDTTLTTGDDIGITITFSEPVSALDASAIITPHATLQSLTSSSGGSVWHATLRASGTGINEPLNAVTLDMSRVLDSAGNAGAGTVASQNYSVDTTTAGSGAPAVVSIDLDHAVLTYDDHVTATIVFSEAVTESSVLTAIEAEHALVYSVSTADGGVTWQAVLFPSVSIEFLSDPVFLTVDMTMLRDLGGNAGAGSFTSAESFVVNTTGYLTSSIEVYDDGVFDNDGVISADLIDVSGALFTPFDPLTQTFELVVGGFTVDSPTDLRLYTGENFVSWYFDGWGEAYWEEGEQTVIARVRNNADGSIASQLSKTIRVDGTGPSITAGPGDDGSFNVANDLVITFSEAVYLDTDSEFVEVDLYATDGSTSTVLVNASHLSGDRTTLTIRANEHHLAAGKSYNLSLPSSIVDVAGNWMSEGAMLPFTTTGSFADTTAPTALQAEVTGFSREYKAGEDVAIVVRFDEPVRVLAGDPFGLTLNNGARAAYVSSSTDGRTLHFSYRVQASDTNVLDLDLADKTELASRVVDNAGNALTAANIGFPELTSYYGFETIAIDTVAPAAPPAPLLYAAHDSGVRDNITNNREPKIHGSGAEPEAFIEVFINGSYAAGTWADEFGAWEVIPPLWLSDGAYQYTARQIDAAGNTGPFSAALSVTIDTSGPAALAAPVLDAASDTGSSNSDGITSDNTPTLSGTGALPNSRVALFDMERWVGEARSDATGAWTITSEALSDGDHYFSVRQYDEQDNKSIYSEDVKVTIDTAGPVMLGSSQGGGKLTLAFDERIVFTAGGEVTLHASDTSLEVGRYVRGSANWNITADTAGVLSQLELNSSYTGLVRMQAAAGSVQDLAGNAALIGVAEFNLLPQLV